MLSDLSSCWYWFPLRRFCWVNESLVHSNVCFPSTACSDVWHDLNLMSVAAFDGDTSDIRRVDLDEWEKYFQSKHGITNLCTWIFHSWLLALKLLRLLSVIYTSIKHQFLVWHASLLTSSVLLTGLRSTLVMLAFPCRHFWTHLFHLIQRCAVSRISFTKLGCAYKMSYVRVMCFIWWQASKGWRKPFQTVTWRAGHSRCIVIDTACTWKGTCLFSSILACYTDALSHCIMLANPDTAKHVILWEACWNSVDEQSVGINLSRFTMMYVYAVHLDQWWKDSHHRISRCHNIT